jgi:biopolymer transport protein TolQ
VIALGYFQITRAIPTTPWEMVTNATLVTQIVLGLLAVLSLLSWAVMLGKWVEFRRVRRAADAFMRSFDRAQSLDEVSTLAKHATDSPFTRVFERAVQFLAQTKPALAASPERTARLSGSQVEALRLVLDAETNGERDTLSRFVPTLATIGSVSPLIGLLGTVLGVISAFTGIATQGSGMATAAALAVAIPAVFGYNIFANRVNRLDSELEGFGSELIALMVREGRI